MKPSERRALLAERQAQREAEERERERQRAERAAAVERGETAPERDEAELFAANEKPRRKKERAESDGHHRESFWSNNARLIAFVVTTVVVLFVVGPLGYDIYLNVSDALSQGNRVEGVAMEIDDVYFIAENGDAIKWSSFEKFQYTDYGGEREFPIEGTDLTLRVGKSSESAYPEYVRLIHYKSGDLIKEIRTVSIYKIEEFIEDHAK